MNTATKIPGHVSFTVSPAEHKIIQTIAHRAVALAAQFSSAKLDPVEITMDITACHANGCPLRLADLLAADNFNFQHDVLGINRFIDRKSGELTGCFTPRFSVLESA